MQGTCAGNKLDVSTEEAKNHHGDEGAGEKNKHQFLLGVMY